MKTLLHTFFLAFLSYFVSLGMNAQTANPSGSYTRPDGQVITDATTAQNAPLVAHFTANPEPDDLYGYTARWEWKIWKADNASDLLVHRFDQDIDYTFTESGTFKVQLYATFVLDGDTITYPGEGEENPLVVVISESKLEMPNAFSPNGDQHNDIYNAKSTYQSIVSFKATVFNRWGQRIYTWTNPNKDEDGWDGTWHGRKVKDGVYYVVVNAKGADGTVYKIRKDVNVLTGYDNNASESSNSDEE